LVHAPFAVAPSAAEHTAHEPVQAVLQQKPSTQLPDSHWRPSVQAPPFASGPTHTPPWQ
jgi:hypothetical protein